LQKGRITHPHTAYLFANARANRMKVLVHDPDTGLQTVLTRMAPGAVLPDHEHVGLEQSWVIEGSLVDHEGEVSAGQFVWRPAGSRHSAHAPNGALVLGIFHQPNRFFG